MSMCDEKIFEQQYFDISGSFRKAVETRIEKLEQDARDDARLIPNLLSEDHQRRVALLVAAQIEEAVRLRTQLSRTGVTVESIHEILTRRQ